MGRGSSRRKSRQQRKRSRGGSKGRSSAKPAAAQSPQPGPLTHVIHTNGGASEDHGTRWKSMIGAVAGLATIAGLFYAMGQNNAPTPQALVIRKDKPEPPPPSPPPPEPVVALTAQLIPAMEDRFAEPERRIFAMPPTLRVTGGPKDTHALEFILRRAKALAAEAPLTRRAVSRDGGETTINLGPVLEECTRSCSGRYEALVSLLGDQFWRDTFSIRRVFEPADFAIRSDSSGASTSAYFNDEGLLTGVTEGVAELRRDLANPLFANDPFSQIVFPAFTRHKTGTVIQGRFRLRDERGGQSYPFTPDIVLQNRTHGRYVQVLFGENEPRNHFIKTDSDDKDGRPVPAATGLGPELDRSGSRWQHFAIVVDRVGQTGARVSAYLSAGPVDLDEDEPVARREVDGWMFEEGVHDIRFRLWRGGTCWLGPLVIEEL